MFLTSTKINCVWDKGDVWLGIDILVRPSGDILTNCTTYHCWWWQHSSLCTLSLNPPTTMQVCLTLFWCKTKCGSNGSHPQPDLAGWLHTRNSDMLVCSKPHLHLKKIHTCHLLVWIEVSANMWQQTYVPNVGKARGASKNKLKCMSCFISRSQCVQTSFCMGRDWISEHCITMDWTMPSKIQKKNLNVKHRGIIFFFHAMNFRETLPAYSLLCTSVLNFDVQN